MKKSTHEAVGLHSQFKWIGKPRIDDLEEAHRYLDSRVAEIREALKDEHNKNNEENLPRQEWEEGFLAIDVEHQRVVTVCLSTGGPGDEYRLYIRGETLPHQEFYKMEYHFIPWGERGILEILEDSELWKLLEQEFDYLLYEENKEK